MRAPRYISLLGVGLGVSYGVTLAPASATTGDREAAALSQRLMSSTAMTSGYNNHHDAGAATRHSAGQQTVVASLGESQDVVPRYTRFGFDSAGRPIVEGRSTPHAHISIQLDGAAAGAGVASDSGRWAVTLDRGLGTGVHRIGVTSRSPGATRAMTGDDLRIAMPRGYQGRSVTLFGAVAQANTAEGPAPASRDDIARRAAELSAAASAKFTEVLGSATPSSGAGSDAQRPVSDGKIRLAQVTNPQGSGTAPAKSGTAVTAAAEDEGVFDWFFRFTDSANKDFQDVMRRMSGVAETSLPKAPAPATPATVPPPGPVATAPAPAVAPLPPAATAKTPPPAKAPTPAAPKAAVAPPVTAPAPKTAAPAIMAQADTGSPVADWLDKAAKDYQDVMKRLTEPTGTPPSAPSTAPATTPVAPTAAAGAAAIAAAEAARKAAAEAKMAADKAAAEVKTVADAKALNDAKRVDEERKLAETRRAEAAKAEEAKKMADAKLAVDKAAADAKRAADTKAAADAKAAADKAAAEKAVADAKAAADKAAADKAAADAKAAADKLAADAKAATERAAAEAKAIADAKAASEAKMAAEKVALAAAKSVDEKRAAELKLAEERARLDESQRLADAARRAAEAKKLAEDKAATEARKAADAQKAMAVAQADIVAAATASAKRAAESKLMAEADKAGAAAKRAEAAVTAASAAKPGTGTGASSRPSAPAAGDKMASAKPPARSTHTKVAQSKPAKRPARERSCEYSGLAIDVPGWYVVKRGDTLSKVAMRFYHNPDVYARIYRTNRRLISDPDLIYPCQRIYLPRRKGG